MKALIQSLATVSAVLTLCCGAQAAGPRGACKEDVKTYCSDVKPGGGRIKDCLEDHYKQLSDACYTALQEHEKRQEEGGHDGPPPAGGDGKGPPPPPPPRGGDDNVPPPPPPAGENGPQNQDSGTSGQ